MMTNVLYRITMHVISLYVLHTVVFNKAASSNSVSLLLYTCKQHNKIETEMKGN
jgi:hypothetical protein